MTRLAGRAAIARPSTTFLKKASARTGIACWTLRRSGTTTPETPLELSLSGDGTAATRHVLGTALDAGERPQIVVPAGHWQAARSLGAWTLVGFTVAPGFQFEIFEMAPPGWEPGQA